MSNTIDNRAQRTSTTANQIIHGIGKLRPNSHTPVNTAPRMLAPRWLQSQYETPCELNYAAVIAGKSVCGVELQAREALQLPTSKAGFEHAIRSASVMSNKAMRLSALVALGHAAIDKNIRTILPRIITEIEPLLTFNILQYERPDVIVAGHMDVAIFHAHRHDHTTASRMLHDMLDNAPDIASFSIDALLGHLRHITHTLAQIPQSQRHHYRDVYRRAIAQIQNNTTLKGLLLKAELSHLFGDVQNCRNDLLEAFAGATTIQDLAKVTRRLVDNGYSLDAHRVLSERIAGNGADTSAHAITHHFRSLEHVAFAAAYAGFPPRVALNLYQRICSALKRYVSAELTESNRDLALTIIRDMQDMLYDLPTDHSKATEQQHGRISRKLENLSHAFDISN